MDALRRRGILERVTFLGTKGCWHRLMRQCTLDLHHSDYVGCKTRGAIFSHQDMCGRRGGKGLMSQQMNREGLDMFAQGNGVGWRLWGLDAFMQVFNPTQFALC